MKTHIKIQIYLLGNTNGWLAYIFFSLQINLRIYGRGNRGKGGWTLRLFRAAPTSRARSPPTQEETRLDLRRRTQRWKRTSKSKETYNNCSITQIKHTEHFTSEIRQCLGNRGRTWRYKSRSIRSPQNRFFPWESQTRSGHETGYEAKATIA